MLYYLDLDIVALNKDNCVCTALSRGVGFCFVCRRIIYHSRREFFHSHSHSHSHSHLHYKRNPPPFAYPAFIWHVNTAPRISFVFVFVVLPILFLRFIRDSAPAADTQFKFENSWQIRIKVAGDE